MCLSLAFNLDLKKYDDKQTRFAFFITLYSYRLENLLWANGRTSTFVLYTLPTLLHLHFGWSPYSMFV